MREGQGCVKQLQEGNGRGDAGRLSVRIHFEGQLRCGEREEGLKPYERARFGVNGRCETTDQETQRTPFGTEAQYLQGSRVEQHVEAVGNRKDETRQPVWQPAADATASRA